MWGDYENETLIHNHKMAKIYKKRSIISTSRLLTIKEKTPSDI